ncbi:MAG TPA: polyprenyl synthetase family protein [Candidatus Saccharimonadales bacterium]|nr:polyprenyl synthetase family protein [Candidatus Saccharimonadales bacterium]
MKELPILSPFVSGFEKDFRNEHFTAEDYLAWFKKAFDKQLLSYLSEKRAEAVEINPETAVLVDELIRYSNSGGKRVRPAFVYSGYVASGGKAKEAVLYASLSVELLHIFALIHDDIIDNSDLRRGEPTTHKEFETIHQKKKLKGKKESFGLSSAILAGDLALSFAEEILTSAPFPQERIRRARYFFDQMKVQVTYGQYLDVLAGYKKNLTEDEVLQILEYKTAKYTVERPLHIGAMLAGADYKDIETFSRYGIPFGQAFQMQDDLVGTFGSEHVIGKPVDSDIKEGKKTLLLVKTYERASAAERKLLNSVVGNQKATKTEIAKVRAIMKRTGAYDYCARLAQQLLLQSRDALVNAKLSPEGKDFLLSAIDYLSDRPL